MLRERKIRCLDVIINYVDEGEGDPLVFLHNGGGFYHIWEKQLVFFRKGYRVIAPDFPGFGESSESDNPYTLEYCFSVVDVFLQQLRLDQVILVGNCIGATIAIQYALSCPDKVRKLVLMNICPGERLIPGAAIKILLFKTRPGPLKTLLASLFRVLIAKTLVRRRFPDILFGDSPDQQSPLYKRYQNKFKEPKQTRSRVKLLFASDTFTLKRVVDDPAQISGALLLWGEKNKVASLAKEGYYHKTQCGIQHIHIIPDCGHLLMFEAPELTNQLIHDYISQ
jgi:pimeloyl-ACP methyl ester carboxylesterase